MHSQIKEKVVAKQCDYLIANPGRHIEMLDTFNPCPEDPLGHLQIILHAISILLYMSPLIVDDIELPLR